MRVPSLLVLFLSATTPALASGGLSCEGAGKQASIQVEGGVTRGMGGPLFSFNGSAQIAAKGVAADLRKIAFDRENVASVRYIREIAGELGMEIAWGGRD